jgi:Na+-driven multidrug efflux pump
MKLQGVEQNHSVLNDDRVGRLLAKLSLPAFWGLLVMVLYNVVDTIFIGRYVASLVFQSVGKASRSIVTSLACPLFLLPLMFTLTLLIRQIREFKSAELLKENKVLQAEL